MNLGAIDPSLAAHQANLGQSLGLTKEQATSAKQTFSDYLDKSMASLNQSMAVVNDGTKDLVSGKVEDLGQIMVNMTEAQLNLQTAVQVRNKVITAYNDLKEMQF